MLRQIAMGGRKGSVRGAECGAATAATGMALEKEGAWEKYAVDRIAVR